MNFDNKELFAKQPAFQLDKPAALTENSNMNSLNRMFDQIDEKQSFAEMK
ncbi:MAG: hypothetical protein LBB88_06950 [Planctomycetaceae bacterium]|jgi:hypothetical protein|nr:hypothetical protein [Planctomycetaceae bacterium]